MDRTEAKDRFVNIRGYWDEEWGALQRRDPGFAGVAIDLTCAAVQSSLLSPRIVALCRLAFYASATKYDKIAMQREINICREQGLSADMIMESLYLVAVVGVHSCATGVPILAEELEALNRSNELEGGASSKRVAELRQKFTEKRGYWADLWNIIVNSSPDFFEAYLSFSSYPWDNGSLSPKEREFIYIAIDVAVHHLFEPGLRIHIRNALGYGATGKEVLELFQLLAVESVTSAVSGAAMVEN